jgi:ribosomal protein S27AE
MPTLQHTKKTSFKQNDAINTLMDQSNCGRCGGLMVDVQCLDIEDPSGQLWFDAKHCVQCGNVIDPLILKNQSVGHRQIQGQDRIPVARPSYAIAIQGKKRL